MTNIIIKLEDKNDNNKLIDNVSSVICHTNSTIPIDVDLNHVYNPPYSVTELMSTKHKQRLSNSNHLAGAFMNPNLKYPKRPPNSFFLMKNCYMLELKKLGYRFTMPTICKQSKEIWSNCSQQVKEKYDDLALKALIIHQDNDNTTDGNSNVNADSDVNITPILTPSLLTPPPDNYYLMMA
ncbi:1127_t:CDS:2 [Entrophospora sp. SA101]|nr:1127_t:CDS:2 [Entrophospora sp. SA101]